MSISELTSAVRKTVLIRKKRVLEIIPISKSTLHVVMNRDPSFPRPLYLNGGRIPFWREPEIHEWVAVLDRKSRGTPAVAEMSACQPESSATTSAVKEDQHPAVAVARIKSPVLLLARPACNGLKRTIKVEPRKKRVFDVATPEQVTMHERVTQGMDGPVDQAPAVTPAHEQTLSCGAGTTPQFFRDETQRGAEMQPSQPLYGAMMPVAFPAWAPAKVLQPTHFGFTMNQGFGGPRVW